MNYREFRENCLITREPIAYLMCGSAFELPLKFFISNPTDSDRLFYVADICAIPENRNPPKNFQGTVLTIESINNHSGFARLKLRDSSNTYFLRPKALCSDNNKGPAVVLDSEYCLPLMLKLALQFFSPRWRYLQQIKTDKSYSVYCPYWPPEAQEWLTRKRQHGWPNESLIARVKKGGCHFVSKPHQNNLHDNTQWRFSFSKAELILIHSWTPVQKEVYHMLRLVKNKITDKCGGSDETALRTYHFKTLMLWACEQKPSEFWNVNTITACVHELLNDMIKTLKDRHCPNYFISENNMLDYMEGNNSFKKELKILTDCVNHECSDPAATKIAVFNSSNLAFSPSNKLYEFLFLSSRSNVFPLDEKLNGPLRNILYRCECFLPELKHLYNAIRANVRLVSINEVSNRKTSNDYSVAYSGYTAAINASTDEANKVKQFDFSCLLDSSAMETLQRTVLWPIYLHRKCIETKSDIRCELHARGKELGYLESGILTSQPSNEKTVEGCSTRKDLKQKIVSYLMKQFAKASSKQFPSPMYLMSAAYLANFYFTTTRDDEKTLSICDEIYRANLKFRKLLGNCIHFLANLPLLITSDFSTIFDEHIRTVLGFVVLYKGSSSSSSPDDLRKVTIPLSPIRFVRYIECQCKIRSDTNAPQVFAYTPDDSEHTFNGVRMRVCFSEVFLSAAMRCGGVKILRLSSQLKESSTSFGEVVGRIRCRIESNENFEAQIIAQMFNRLSNVTDTEDHLELHQLGLIMAEHQADGVLLYVRFRSPADVKRMRKKLKPGKLRTAVENDFKKLFRQPLKLISASVEWFPGDYERCIKGFNHN